MHRWFPLRRAVLRLHHHRCPPQHRRCPWLCSPPSSFSSSFSSSSSSSSSQLPPPPPAQPAVTASTHSSTSSPVPPPQQEMFDRSAAEAAATSAASAPTTPSRRSSQPPGYSPPSSSSSSSSPADPDASASDPEQSAFDPELIDSINQLTISTDAAADAAGTETISHKPLAARYKPQSRSATVSSITPSPHSLTTLQLHRLLTLHAMDSRRWTAEVLAQRFGLRTEAVRRLLFSLAASRLVELGRAGDTGNAEIVAVRDSTGAPPGSRVSVQGQHLAQHLQDMEDSNQRA